jgi:hypothetical protein
VKLIEFFKNHPGEEECKAAFKENLEQQGVICKNCKSKNEYW